MIEREDKLSSEILRVINTSSFPLETKEIERVLNKTTKGISRTKIFYRLNNLRGDGLVKGKFVGSGKGVWVWWSASAFGAVKK